MSKGIFSRSQVVSNQGKKKIYSIIKHLSNMKREKHKTLEKLKFLQVQPWNYLQAPELIQK